MEQNKISEALAILQERSQNIKDRLKVIEQLLDNKYMTRDQFDAEIRPIRSIVYGMVGAILLAVLGAIIALVVKK